MAAPPLVALLVAGRVPAAAAPAPVQQRDSAVARATATAGMVVTGSPYASRAGARILEQGGNAIDAAVAAAFALAVTEHSQTGLGGRTQALVARADGSFFGIDGTTQVPAGYDPASAPRGDTGYATIGVPGTVATLAALHRRAGTLPLAALIEPARRFAADGFAVPAGEASRMRSLAAEIEPGSTLGRAWLRGGALPSEGESHVQSDLARTLEALSRDGPASFYTGDLARRISDDIMRNGGFVTGSDLAAYEPADAPVVRGRYRDLQIAGTYIPASGATVIQILTIIERFRMAALDDAGRAVIAARALEVGFADRETGLAMEPAAAMAWLLSDSLADRRATELRDRLPEPLRAAYRGPVGTDAALAATEPAGARNRAYPGVAGPDGYYEEPPNTTHLVVADTFGNVVSMTQSLGPSFGSRVMTPGLGFLYASTMGYLAGERPGYRPFSSQAPLILLRDGRPVIAIGGGGARRILSALVWTIVQHVDAGLSLADALAVPRIHPDGDRIQVQPGWRATARLNALGVRTDEREPDWFARLNGIEIVPGGSFSGVGEPRWPDSSARGPGG